MHSDLNRNRILSKKEAKDSFFDNANTGLEQTNGERLYRFSQFFRTADTDDDTILTWSEFLAVCKVQAWKENLEFDQSDYKPPTFGDEPPSTDGIAPEDMSWFIKFRLDPWFDYATTDGPCNTYVEDISVSDRSWP